MWDLLTAPVLTEGPTTIVKAQFLVALLAIAVMLITTYWRSAVGSHRMPAMLMPLPGGLPILGHVWVLRHYDNLHNIELEGLRRSGWTCMGLSLPAQPLLIFTADPRNVEHVLKTKFDNYIKGTLFKERMGDALGDGIFNTDGHSWWLQRKSVSRIFSEAAFHRATEQVFSCTMRDLRARLDAAAASGSPVDLQDLLLRYTFDSFCTLALGYEPHSLKVEGRVPFMDAFDRMTTTLCSRFWVPGWKLLELFNQRGRQMRQDIKYLRETFHNVVTDKLAAAQAGAAYSSSASPIKDLITLVIEMARSDPSAESAEILSEKFLVDVVINMLLAGRDTTAQGLAWCLYYVMQDPQVQGKIAQEVADHADSEGKLDYKSVKQLKYTTAVFQEALRLQPSVPTVPKTAVRNDVLPDGTHVPAGATLCIASYSVGRNPHVWGPDAEVFRPERWLERATLPSPWDYPSFNGGPRICLGRNMALLEGTYVLAELLSNFNFKIVAGHVVGQAMSLTNPMKHGLLVHVLPRKHRE